MPNRELMSAVSATISGARPDFAAVVLRSRRRRAVARTGAILALVAASMVWLTSLPAPTPGFEDQVEAFVALVWTE